MSPQTISSIVAMVVAIIILLFALLILVRIWRDPQALKGIISEPGTTGKASLSRLQFLIFTFVIAGLFLVLSLEAGTFIEIPTGVLVLLGISGGSYVVSKGIGKGQGTP